ncbi:MAG: hypothetical protein LLF78_03245 [Synergistaceae bacterium]|nr:hypothetical protein [Synergistaceae bacterium]
MAKVKKDGAATAKRVRRSPEILMKELDTKMKKLEARIYKKNKEAVHHIGAAILKRANFDFSSFTEEDFEDIVNLTPRGNEIIRDIISKAHQN